MARHEVLVSLRQMYAHESEAVEMVSDKVRADLDFDILWQILTKDLPLLVDDLESILASS